MGHTACAIVKPQNMFELSDDRRHLDAGQVRELSSIGALGELDAGAVEQLWVVFELVTKPEADLSLLEVVVNCVVVLLNASKDLSMREHGTHSPYGTFAEVGGVDGGDGCSRVEFEHEAQRIRSVDRFDWAIFGSIYVARDGDQRGEEECRPHC